MIYVSVPYNRSPGGIMIYLSVPYKHQVSFLIFFICTIHTTGLIYERFICTIQPTGLIQIDLFVP